MRVIDKTLDYSLFDYRQNTAITANITAITANITAITARIPPKQKRD